MSEARYWVNAQAGAAIDPGLRALHYGDGLFETLRIEHAKVEYLDRHLQRLRAGCDRLRLNYDDWAGLATELQHYAENSPCAVIKLILSRGAGPRGYRFGPAQDVTRIISLHPVPEAAEPAGGKALRVRLCKLRLATQPALAGIKHLNRLEQVLARSEWTQEYDEGLLLDYNGNLIEGTASNVFLVRGGGLYTPCLDNCGVAGVMRSVVIDLAREIGLKTGVQAIQPHELNDVDEMFMCNSVSGIQPVVALDNDLSFRHGPVTLALQSALDRHDKTTPGNWYSV